MAFESFKLNRKLRKEEKKVEKKEQYAKDISKGNDQLTDFAHRTGEANKKIHVEKAVSKNIETARINAEIREARQNLFIQRDRLLHRLITFNKEYRYILTKPDTPVKQRELKRCSTGAKNAAYALSMVDSAIDRLDNLRSEMEWKDIMHELTQGYKLMNAISTGSDVMNRLAFWLQKARHDIKTDISVESIERYYGRPIEDLLEEQTGAAGAAEMLVDNSLLDLNDEDAVLDSVRWGTAFTVMPTVAAGVAEEISQTARRTGTEPIFEKPGETYESVQDFSAMDIDDMPSMM